MRTHTIVTLLAAATLVGCSGPDNTTPDAINTPTATATTTAAATSTGTPASAAPTPSEQTPDVAPTEAANAGGGSESQAAGTQPIYDDYEDWFGCYVDAGIAAEGTFDSAEDFAANADAAWVARVDAAAAEQCGPEPEVDYAADTEAWMEWYDCSDRVDPYWENPEAVLAECGQEP